MFEANPNNALVLRDHSISWTNLGDFFLRHGQSGDADRALKAYEQGHAMLQHLFEANPSDTRAARDLSISFDRLGDFFLRRGQNGDADRALKAYEDSLGIAQRLFEANTNDGEAAHKLSRSHMSLGDFFFLRGQSGDADRALKAYEDSLSVRQRLFEANPNDGLAARSLSVSLERLAKLWLQEGGHYDPASGRRMLERALAYRTALAETTPGSEELRREQIVTAAQLVEARAATGDIAAAWALTAQLRDLVATYIFTGFDVHPHIAPIASGLGLGESANNPPDLLDAEIDAVLGDPDSCAQLDAMLKAGGLEGGLSALDNHQQRSILRRILQRQADAQTASSTDTETLVSSPEDVGPNAYGLSPPSPGEPHAEHPQIKPSPAPPPKATHAQTRRATRSKASRSRAWVGWVILVVVVAGLVAFAVTQPAVRSAVEQLLSGRSPAPHTTRPGLLF